MTEPAELTGEKATLLATLHGRARDFHSRRPVLGDRFAAEAVDRLDFDVSGTGMRHGDTVGIAMRAKYLDDQAREFLADNPKATVLHLGCGLDARVFRIDPDPEVTWFEVDLPEVMALRAKVYPGTERIRQVSASVTDPRLLSDIPTDRPVLVIAEGLTMYLTEPEGLSLLRAIVDHFDSGAIAFDAFSRWGIARQRASGVVRQSGAKLHWGIDHPAELTRSIPRLSLTSAVSPFALPTAAALSPLMRVLLRVMRVVPRIRRIVRIYRYEF